MAIGIVRAFDVGEGDCVFLLLREGDRQFSVMVDCGRMTPAVKEWIEDRGFATDIDYVQF